MAFRHTSEDDDNQDSAAQRPQPSSAPAVPKELLSARPAMTKVVPRSPDKVAQASQAMATSRPGSGPLPLTPEEVAERQERLDYIKNLRQTEGRSKSRPKKQKKGGSKKWLVVLLVLLLLAGLAGGVYWFLKKPAATKTTNDTSSQNQQPATTAVPQTTNQEATELKDYQSTNFAVSLKYPSTWTVNDTAAKLTITSTPQQLTSAAGAKVSGAVVVTIRPKQAALDEFKAGNAAAVLASKRLSYSQPAAGQRDSTYVSYLQYAKTTTKGALDGIYVTGNSGYQKGQFVPQADVVKVDPLITVSFVQCSDEKCSPAVSPPTNVQAGSWDASELNQTVEAILKSLAIS